LRAGAAHHVGPELAFLQQQAESARRFDCADCTSVSQISRFERSMTGFAAAAGGTDCSPAFVALGSRSWRWSLVVCLLAAHGAGAEDRERAKTNEQRQVAHVVLSNADARAGTHRRKY
jgi:hypothetical protein